MRRIKNIREDYNLVTEKEQTDISKLTALVRAGLFDAKKIGIVKRALEKNPAEMTLAERKILIELLESLMSEVLHSQQVYSKVKQNVMGGKDKMNEAAKDSYLTKFDPRMTKYPSESDIPAVLILKRKAIRVYPDNQKVALYYAQAIDKYVSIPYGNINTAINEENIEEKFTEVPITTYSVKQQEKANKIVDKVGKDPVNNAGIKAGMYLRRKIGGPVKKASTATSEYVGKKVDKLTKKPKISLGNLTKGFKADRATGKEKAQLNPRSYDSKIASPESSPMHKIGKGISGFGKKTGMFETFEDKIKQKRMMKEVSAKDVASAADDVADVTVPLYSAGKKALKGDYKGALIDAGIDAAAAVAAPFTGGGSYAARIAGKTAAKAAEKAAAKGAAKTAEKEVVKDKTKDAAKDAVKDTAKVAEKEVATAKPSLARRVGNKVKRIGGKVAGAAGAIGTAAAAALAGAGDSNKSEKTFTEPKGQFKLGTKISSAEKIDTEVARNRKRESQYDKSLTTSESVIAQLYTIRESHNDGYINIDNNNITINKIIAEKVINVFESLNDENQKKVNAMMNESVDSFKKIINFAVRQ